MKTYETVDEAYRSLSGVLIFYARRHLYRPDLAIDAVHDAFTRTLDYTRKNPGKRVSGFLLQREVARACRRLNRFSAEVSLDAISESVFKEDFEGDV